ncbi:protein kinase domain-containing protein [Micromonospora sp. SH-82]|uniref:serine/threonine-protein kinase n=1 Tax=Micromonospora sp. SH-82 TaxID=3132938 RepID=UPI003EBD29D8
MTQIPTWSGGPASPSNGRAAPGTTIGDRYSLRSPVGNGGMGTVWRATDTLLRRDVAVKEVILPPGLAPSDRDAMYERTLREARAAAAIQHPAVVQVYDVVTESGRPWIVMELLDARSLADMVIEDGPVAPRAVAKIGIALLGALEVAHSIGVLHRDVKPANVLICTDGRCVLTDFGVARMPTDVQLTTPGMVLGSPHFISPERAMGQDFGPPSDLFSLGVTLYTAVEGRPPFDRGDPIETMHAVVEDPPAAPSRSGPLTPVLMGLLEKDPARRMDVHTARAQLRELLTGALTSNATAVHSVTDPYAVVPPQRPVTPPTPAAKPRPKPTGAIGGSAMIGPGESLTDRLAALAKGENSKQTPGADGAAGSAGAPTGLMPTPAGKPATGDSAEETLRLGAEDRAAAARPAADATQAVPFGTSKQNPFGARPTSPAGPFGARPAEAASGVYGNRSDETQRFGAGQSEATQRFGAGQAEATQRFGVGGAGTDATQAVPAWGPPAGGSPYGGGNQWSVPGTGQPWANTSASGPTGEGPAKGRAGRLVATVKGWPRRTQVAAAAGLVLVLVIGMIALGGGDEESPEQQPVAGPSATAEPVGSDLELREHSARGVRVMVPKDWKRATGGSFVDFTDPEDSGRRVRIIVENFGTTSLRWAEVASDGLRTRNTCAKPYNQITMGETELAGKAAAEFEYTCGDGDQRRHGVWRGVVHDGKAYSFYLTSGHDRFEESKPIFDEMVKSFQLTGSG